MTRFGFALCALVLITACDRSVHAPFGRAIAPVDPNGAPPITSEREAPRAPDGTAQPGPRGLDPVEPVYIDELAPTPVAAADTPLPTSGGTDPRALDTVSAAEKAEATAAPAPQEAASERKLGQSVASLGAPAEAGLWVQTPLVSSVTQGRVVNVATGKSLKVELRPIPSGGAMISLSAMQALGIGLADLPTLDIYAL